MHEMIMNPIITCFPREIHPWGTPDKFDFQLLILPLESVIFSYSEGLIKAYKKIEKISIFIS